MRSVLERKMAEETLWLTRGKIGYVIDNLGAGLAIMDEKNVVTYVNSFLAKMLGYEVNELVGKTPYSFLDEDNLTRVDAEMAKRRRGKPSSYEITLTSKGGDLVPVMVIAQPIFNEQKQFAGTHLLAFDLTERKRMEEELRETGERYRELCDSLPQTVFEFDEIGNLTFANRIAFDAFGYAQEDFEKGLNALQTLIPEDRGRARRNIRRAMSGERLVGNEYTAQRKDGSTFPVLIYSSRIIREGRPVGLRGIIVDLTERKRMEATLRVSEERYRTLVEMAHDGIMMTEGPRQTIRFANRKAMEILGYTFAELEGKRFEDLIHPDEKAKTLRKIRRSLRPGKGGMHVARLVRRDGPTMHALISASSVSPGGEARSSSVILVVTDITENVEVRETLGQAEGKIAELKKEIADLKWSPVPETIRKLRKHIGIAELLELPDHFRETLIALSEMEQATASQVAEKTGRVRSLESSYLNRLERMGLIEKARKGRETYFRSRYVRGPAVRRVLEQVYEERERENNASA